MSRWWIHGWWSVYLASIFSLTPAAQALDPEKKITQYLQTQWTVAEGLPQSTVYAGLQTEDGFLWLGTQEGLVRFDGVGFKVFNRINTPILRDQNIGSLQMDNQSRLWIGTDQGLYLRDGGVIREAGGDDALKNILIWTLEIGTPGQIWVGTESKGLLVVEDDVLQPSPQEWGLNRDPIYAVLPSDDGETLWIGGAEGLFCVKSGEIKHFGEAGGYTYGPVYEFVSSGNGDLWISADEGLIRYRQGQFRLFTKEDGLDSSYIYAIHEDRDGSLWIGTESGLARFRENRFELEKPKVKGEFNPINDVWEDREGNLWAGRSNDGLFRYSNVPFTTYAEEEGLSHNFVWAVIQDAEGRMVIGSDHGLSRFDGETFESISVAHGLPDNRVRSLEMDEDGGLWVGTAVGTITRFGKGPPKHYRLGLGGKPRNSVAALNFDKNGRLWVGSNLGISILDNGVFIKPKGPLANEPNLAIHCDVLGTVWVSSYSRAGYYKDGDPFAFRELSLPNAAEILCFYKDGRGDIWLGTYGMGLWRFDGANVAVITKEQGLFDNTVYSILEEDGFLWFSCNRGLFKVALEDLTAVASGRAHSLESVNYGLGDGMKSAECNGATWPVGYKSNSGHFWYATTWGVVRVDPDNTRSDLPTPQIHITDIQVDSDLRETGKVVEIDASNKQVIITYTAPSFRQPDLLHFRYRLKGFDDNWSQVGTRRTAYFNHLPRGSYQFEVMATYDREPWPTNSETVTIKVTQSLISRPYLIPVLSIAAFFMLFLFFWNRLKKEHGKGHIVSGLVDQAAHKVERLEGAWDHVQEEYLATIVEAGVGEMAGKVLQAVNQGLEDTQHRILNVENMLRGQNLDQRLRRLTSHFDGQTPHLKEAHPLNALDEFAEALKGLRGGMLKEVVAVCDEIHSIGEMVEVQQDYAILEQKIEKVSLASLVADVLRMQGPYLKGYKICFRRDWQDLPPTRVHVLKLFLTLCGIVRQIAKGNKSKISSMREGLIEIFRAEKKFTDLCIWAPTGESLEMRTDSLSKLTFLQEVQWLLAEGSEGELTLLEGGNRQGYRIRLRYEPSK